jgi:glycerol-3-phosphate dehydrogenase (NAD(P)+)
MSIQRIITLGGGAWGTALAHLVAKAGSDSLLWARDSALVENINQRHENATYLPGLSLDPDLRASSGIEDIRQCDAVLLVVPAQAVRGITKLISSYCAPEIPLLCCAKGVENGTGLLMSEVIAENLPNNPVGCLSGPTFAAEAVQGMPTAVALAFPDASIGDALASAIGTASFRPYVSDDVIGAEVGGAVKNVLAIACGISAGMGLGENTRAALITRGLAEVTRLAIALGGRRETLAGLAGLGDLSMTCGSRQSRNFRFGEALGKGQSVDTVLAGIGGVVEGRHTAQAIARRAKDMNVEMPICRAVDAVLNHGADLRSAIEDLMHRPFRAETDDRVS